VTLPRWVLRIGWAVHRALHRVTGGRIGTEPATPTQLGTLFLLTTGSKTGQPRRNGLFYLPEGDAFVVVASNAGLDEDPAWWRNLQAMPEAIVELGGREYPVRAREAVGEERDRLYARFEAAADQYRVYRETVTRAIPVIVLERRSGGAA
jgi:deazaflavin-dependent oxidoreductase (nitroreductase family)